uniref:BspA family leucine-rich repeat surface protein n=1 Tax=viral metagenome TaxID=1070528 RepID=A0A6C0ACB3_9ZZZZ
MVFQPKNRDELKEAVDLWCNDKDTALKKYGDISKWDTSSVTNMSHIFFDSQFNGDISKWNTSKVIDMNNMFSNSEFNRDISKWDTSNVTDMSDMFFNSEFNGDISKWNTSNVTDMICMFTYSDFNGDISKWDTSKVKDMSWMFYESQFNGDISNWNFSNIEDDINDIGIKIVKKWTIVKVDKKDIKCCVLLQSIKNEFIKCSTCHKYFDISIKDKWIDKKNSCPMCTVEWYNNKVYLME